MRTVARSIDGVLPWWIMALAGASLIVLEILVVGIVFPSGVLTTISAATAGIVRPTLLANLLIASIVIGGILIGLGGLRAGDLGWDGDVRLATIATLAVWAMLNALETIQGRITGTFAIDPSWTTRPAALVAQWFAVTFGTALLEETIFRGVLPMQLMARMRRARFAPVAAMTVAVVVSQALFAAMHLPALMTTGASSPGSALIGFFVAGCALATLYLATDNLFLCIGIHGLADAPTLIVVDRWDLLEHQTFVVCVSLACAAASLALRKRR